tara:strand:+ start:240 stop:602 length:363 start_codon:yes stop_codon:yes gene_type:complete
MPRNPKGELNLADIRNLARQHNKLSKIVGIDTKTRGDLMQEIWDQGYIIDHEKKKIVKSVGQMASAKARGKKSDATVGPAGDKKPQKKTIKKAKREALKKGSGKHGGNPIYVKDRAEDEV